MVSLRSLRRLFYLCLALIPSAAPADEWWTWTMVEFVHAPPWKAGVFIGSRLDREAGYTSHILSPRARYELLPWLDLGVGLSLLDIHSPQSDHSFLQVRPELELNPHFVLTPAWRLDMRNRFEWRWNEGQTFTTSRSRHRVQLAWTFPRPLGPWTRLFASHESLLDVHRQAWTEQRFIPLGITFKMAPKTDLDLFYMINSTHFERHWRHESVLGTYLRVRW